MRIPRNIRHSVANLTNLSVSAALIEGSECSVARAQREPIASMTALRRRLFQDSIGCRFGRAVDLESFADGTLVDVARVLQTAPRSPGYSCRRVLRRGVPGGGRLLMLPGIHGVSWSFTRLASLLPASVEVVAWDYPGVLPEDRIPSRIDDIASMIHQTETAFSDPRSPLTVFGFCLGGSIGHAVLARRSTLENCRLVAFDSHPTAAISGISRMRRVLGIASAMRTARSGGWIENRLVKMGIRQIGAMDHHRPARVDVDLTLIRSGARLILGELDATNWGPLVRSVDVEHLADLGHIDVFRRSMEERIVERLHAA